MVKWKSSFHLSKTVFFRKIGNVVYARNIATGEDFVFNKEAGPILSALRDENTERSLIIREQRKFIHELFALGLVCRDDDKNIDRVDVPISQCHSPLGGCDETHDDIVYRIQEACRRRHLLWSAGLELTYRCNERCKHCYCDLKKEQTTVGEMTEHEWLNVVDQLASIGCMNVLVTGGEPTLHPAFLAVCERIIARGMLCDVYTNGLQIGEELLNTLCRMPLNSISVSLYSGTSNFHDKVTGVPGSFQKTLETLNRFKDAGLNAYAKVPVFHRHLADFFAAKALGEKYGFRILASTILVPGHSGGSRNAMMMSAAEYGRFLKCETMPNTGVEKSAAVEKFKSEPLCQAGQSTLCISPFGEVMPCNSFPAVCGNVREAPIAKIWRTSGILEALRRMRRCDVSPRCAKCEDIAYCSVCPGASWNESKGRITPCSWSCEQAHVRAIFNRQTKRKQSK